MNENARIAGLHFLVRRALTYLVVFIVVLNVVFILPRLLPGSAAQILASSKYLSTTAVAQISARLGLDQPVQVQYISYLKNIFLVWPPYFGVSYTYFPAPVTDLVATRIGWTLFLIITSTSLGLFVTYMFGAVVAQRRRGKFETGSLYSSIVLNSVPLFWLAMILLFAGAIAFHLFPVSGAFDVTVGPGFPYYVSILWHAVLPIVVLSLSLVGQYFLLLRGSMQDVLKSDFVLAAQSRGLSNWSISSGYILRNSLLPLVSVMSFSMAGLISRVVLVEFVFGYPGVGDLFVDGVLGRDFPVLEGSFFYLTVIIIACGLVGDFVLTRLDPRLRD
jgi:peptide/nickel transport system permease protein